MSSPNGYIAALLVGLSFSSLFLVLKNLRSKRRVLMVKLKIIREVLDQANRRLDSLQERHDALLAQVCSNGLFCNRELHHALLEARRAAAEASEFANALRRLQVAVITSFPDPPPQLVDRRSPPGCTLCSNSSHDRIRR